MAETQHLLPQIYIEGEGMAEPTSRQLMADLVDITVESSLHLPDVASLVLHDTRLRWLDDASLEPGKGLKVSAKSAEGEHLIFDGEIVEIEPDFQPSAQRLVVRAFDRLHRLARGRVVRSFV